MKKSIYIVLLSAFSMVFASSLTFAQEPPKQSTIGEATISLYGNPFTIDPSFIDRNNGDRPHSWKNIAYYIPQLLPGVRGDEDKRSVEETLNTITKVTLLYRNLYARAIENLSVRLEKEGHFKLLEANETDPQELKLLREILPFSTPEERVNAIDAYIRVWFREGSWKERIETYNAVNEGDDLPPYAFQNPYRMYQYFLSMFYLDTVVRRSPEFAEFAKTYKPE